ncbi:MAG: response regulator transcription factor [Roseburia sp.]|nr:response regulator transcription factor [Roseburia sp.]
MQSRIMLVEDDAVIQEELRILLTANQYDVGVISDFADVMREIERFEPQLLLLDVNLPYEDGFRICARVRAKYGMPIIFVTGRNTDMDELSSIMLGGDAFITKPYNTAILLAKIAALLKRAYPNCGEELLDCRGVRLHVERGMLEYQGQSVELTRNEQKIIWYLMRHAGKICPRADLTEYLWDNQLYIDDNALSVNITRIREKLSGIGLTDFIRTKHGQGYIV